MTSLEENKMLLKKYSQLHDPLSEEPRTCFDSVAQVITLVVFNPKYS